ncbi:MAG TPA: hypothetical protein VMB73_21995 [Acetobacteraceae bacterium]|nr:hypothetical protein [Acetobacteraceae bacterium]
MAAVACRGTATLPAANVREWLNGPLLADELGSAEDPAEDVFASCIVSWPGTIRLFEGIWEANDYYLQTLLSAINQPAVRRVLNAVFRPIRALLLLSDAVATRSGVARFASSEGRPRQSIRLPQALAHEAANRVTFGLDELAKMGILPDELQPFLFDPTNAGNLIHEIIGHTSLERRPIIRTAQGGIVLALPTAVSAALRRFVIESAADLRLSGILTRCVQELHLAHVLEALDIGWNIEVIGEPVFNEECRTHEFQGAFDTGGYVQVYLAHDDPLDVIREGLYSFHEISPVLGRQVAAGITELSKRADFRFGMTLLVHGGFGRGFAADLGQPVPGWSTIGLSVHDLVLLSREVGFSAIRAWKLLRQVSELEAVGFTVMNPNGFVNLYAFSEQQDFQVVPPEATGGLILVANNFVAALRERLRRAFDFHAARSWKDELWFEVERREPMPYFRDDEGRPLYACPAEARARHLLGCVEEGSRTIWIACWDTDGDQHHRSVAFQVWDMALNWLDRASQILAESLPVLPDVFAFVITFPDLREWSGEGRLFDGLPQHPTIEWSGTEVRIGCRREYLAAFGMAENTGDRWMVEAMVEGACGLAGIAAGEERVRQIADRIVPDTQSRFFHSIPATTAGDLVRAATEMPTPRLVQTEDDFRSGFRLPMLAGYDGKGGPLTKEEASPLLAKAVDVLWARIKKLLVTLDRGALIQHALVNHEAIEKDRDVWRMTASAVLAIHPDRESTLATAAKRESDRARSSTALRVLVEMAVCTSPLSGGLVPAAIDLDQLLADIAALIEVANVSDALHYRLYEGRLVVQPNMTFDFSRVLADVGRGGYFKAHGYRSYLAAASRYEDYFESAGETAPELTPAFEAACVAEFGASLSKLAEIAFMLAGWAAREGTPVVRARRSSVIRAICDLPGTTLTTAECVVRRLSLSPRQRWDEDKPEGAARRDWYPWRYGRKLSLTRRPLLLLADDADPEMLVSAGLFDRSLRHLAGTWAARLPSEMFDTAEMHAWIGTAIDRTGHAFNKEVCEALRSLGLQAIVEVSMQRFGAPGQLGDVDVLAWRPDSRVVNVIECKRLSEARTVGEVGERLKEYTDLEPTGKSRTPVKRHLDRVAFLKANLSAVANFVGLPEPLTLRSCVVTEALVPMQFSRKAAALIDVFVDMSGLAVTFR